MPASARRARPRRRGSLARRLLRALGAAAGVLVVIVVALVLLLRWVNPPTSAFMLEARVHAWVSGERHYRTHYDWVPIESISPQAAIAVVASEDQGFPTNAGFDVNSIREALRAHEHGERLRGASTITQQVAKNLFLSADRSFVRKGIEAGFTLLIDVLWPKRRVLETYLNIAQFGPGIYGVQAAARHFFHEDAAQLTREQGALLAAVLPNPLRLRVDRPSRYVLDQQAWILQQIGNLGGPAYLHSVVQWRSGATPRRHREETADRALP